MSRKLLIFIGLQLDSSETTVKKGNKDTLKALASYDCISGSKYSTVLFILPSFG